MYPCWTLAIPLASKKTFCIRTWSSRRSCPVQQQMIPCCLERPAVVGTMATSA